MKSGAAGSLKVATGYLVVSWLAMEIGHTLFNVFELPHTGLQLIFVLLVVGFPLAPLGAWQGWFGAALNDKPHGAGGPNAVLPHESEPGSPWCSRRSHFSRLPLPLGCGSSE